MWPTKKLPCEWLFKPLYTSFDKLLSLYQHKTVVCLHRFSRTHSVHFPFSHTDYWCWIRVLDCAVHGWIACIKSNWPTPCLCQAPIEYRLDRARCNWGRWFRHGKRPRHASFPKSVVVIRKCRCIRSAQEKLLLLCSRTGPKNNSCYLTGTVGWARVFGSQSAQKQGGIQTLAREPNPAYGSRQTGLLQVAVLPTKQGPPTASSRPATIGAKISV